MPEQIHSVHIPGIPPHELQLKVGIMVMFIRNLSFNINAIKGGKGVITAIYLNLIEVRLFRKGIQPHIAFEGQVSKNIISFHRHQYPLRIAYAMTVNKSQGQPLHTLGLDLRDYPFSHGQLYVALSRAQGSQHMRCLVEPQRILDNIPYVANIVFSALLSPIIPVLPGIAVVQNNSHKKNIKRPINTLPMNPQCVYVYTTIVTGLLSQ